MRLIIVDNTDIWRDQQGKIRLLEALSTKSGNIMKKQWNNIYHFDTELSLPQSAMCVTLHWQVEILIRVMKKTLPRL
jgi:hypothetical protein